jgi:hypothetical protein
LNRFDAAALRPPLASGRAILRPGENRFDLADDSVKPRRRATDSTNRRIILATASGQVDEPLAQLYV